MTEENRYEALSNSIIDARGEYVRIELDGEDERYKTRVRRHRPGILMHFDAAAPAGRPQQVRRSVERLAGDRGGTGRDECELPAVRRPQALARITDPRVRAVHRHPHSRTRQPGGSAPGVVRRTVDHQRLRPLRGERPLLPAAAARDQGLRRIQSPPTLRSSTNSTSTTAPCGAGTDRSTTPPTAVPTSVSRTDSSRPARLPSTWSPTPPSTTVSPSSSSERIVPCGRGCRSAEAEENFFACAKDGIDARVTWPKIGHIDVADLVLDVLIPQARRGSEPSEHRQRRHRRIHVDHRRPRREAHQRCDLAAEDARPSGTEQRPGFPGAPRGTQADDGRLRGEPGVREPVHTWDVPV